MYETRQTTILFPSRLNGCCYEEKKGSHGPQFLEAYSEASHINNSIPKKEKDPGSFTLPCFINNVYFDNALVDLGSSVSVMPLLTYLNLGLRELAHTKLTVELTNRTMQYVKGIAENVLVRIGKFTFPVDFLILDMPKDIKVLLILERPFLSTAHAKIDVYKRKITLRVREERIVFTSVKPASSLIKRVYMLSLREIMELDLEARLMGETLVLNRSLDSFFEDYIKLNDLNEPFDLRRNQGDNLMPTIEEGKVIKEFKTRDDELDIGIDDYPSYCDYDKHIHIDCAHNLKFSCMMGFEFTHANFFPLLYVNVISKKFHNSIIKDKMVYKGNNVVGALMNVPIFVGTFSAVTNFAVLENMDVYRDEGMGDVIFGEPVLREVGIKTKTLIQGGSEQSHVSIPSLRVCMCVLSRPPGILVSIEIVIMEYLVNISKRRTFWSLNKDILKITILTTNSLSHVRTIRLITVQAASIKDHKRKEDQYAISKKKVNTHKGTELMKDNVSQERVCEEEVLFNNNIGKQSGDLVEMPSEVVERGMDDHVFDEIDDARGKQVPKHVVKKGNLEFLVCKQVANHGGDKLVDKGRLMKRKKVYAE
ncbi:putative reverse transcriptase domain-containing protein [Tanacetum coccineum]